MLAEIGFSKLTSLMILFSVCIAVVCVSACILLIDDYDKKTDLEIGALEERTRQRMDDLERESRAFTKSLGFNIFVHHRDLDLAHYFATDEADHHLRLDQAQALADSKFPYLNHLLPLLNHSYDWEAFGGKVMITGIQGEIFIAKKWQKPLEVEIKSGEVHLGYAIQQKLKLNIGDDITIENRSYRISHVRSKLGTKDDIILWMNLADAQKLLGLEDKISAILALSCGCKPGDIEPIRKGLCKIDPTFDVMEFAVRAKARAQARKAISGAAKQQLDDIVTSRTKVRSMLKSFAFVIAAMIMVLSTVLISFLYANNVKERRSEIAILRTIGYTSTYIYGVFMGKAFALAFSGSVLGALIINALSMLLHRQQLLQVDALTLTTTVIIVICSVATTLLASWLPIRYGMGQSPTEILNQG